MDQWKWYADVMPSKDYEDPVQIQVRKLLNRAMVNTFALFEFKYHGLIKKYMPVLPMPHDTWISRVIQIIKASQVVCLLEMNMEITQIENTGPESAAKKRDIASKFTNTCAQISCGYIARLLLNAICTFQVCKNWNSHGATLGASLCQMASMLLCLDKASTGSLIDVDFNELIWKGNVQKNFTSTT